VTGYKAPLRDMEFALYELFSADKILAALPRFVGLERTTMDAATAEIAKFAERELAPLNRTGDEVGCRLEEGSVTTPPGFVEAYKALVDDGWCALAADVDHGGMGLPETLRVLAMEILGSANMSFSDYVVLGFGGYLTVRAHAAEPIRSICLPRLASGQWAATMCMTEPHCGTDLGLLSTRAERAGDGTYRITGIKIFNSGGDHDLTENIIHLVLARLPDAPPGPKGVSLFLVPKFQFDQEGTLGQRNTVAVRRLERKLGYRGSATCETHFEDAVGWMVGEPGAGLRALFVMVNFARLTTAQQGLAAAEPALQKARSYAHERLQGRALNGPRYPELPADPIVVHPDIRRMLLTGRAFTEAARALLVWAAINIDIAREETDKSAAELADDMVQIVTPILKAGLSEMGFEATSNAMQVFGGHGYIRDTGVEQYLRDGRLSLIQEGANGIQALDLLVRKMNTHSGRLLRNMLVHLDRECEQLAGRKSAVEFFRPFSDAITRLRRTTEIVMAAGARNPDEYGAAGIEYVRLCMLTLMAWIWARSGATAYEALETGLDEAIYGEKLATARVFFSRMLPASLGLEAVLLNGARSLMEPADSSI